MKMFNRSLEYIPHVSRNFVPPCQPEDINSSAMWIFHERQQEMKMMAQMAVVPRTHLFRSNYQ